MPRINLLILVLFLGCTNRKIIHEDYSSKYIIGTSAFYHNSNKPVSIINPCQLGLFFAKLNRPLKVKNTFGWFEIFMDSCNVQNLKSLKKIPQKDIIYPEDMIDSVEASKGKYLYQYQFYFLKHNNNGTYTQMKVINKIYYGDSHGNDPDGIKSPPYK